MQSRATFGSLAAVSLVLSALASVQDPRAPAAGGAFETEVLPFLEQHCFRCHGMEEQKGGLRLDDLSSDFADGVAVDAWLEVIRKLGAGEMPPEDEPERPTAEESARVVQRLAARIAAGEAERRARRERVSFQRLTREEYAHTIHDLLGVHFDVADAGGLREDDRWRGFERVGSALSLSASHVERYLAAAETILAEAYPPAPPESSVVAYDAVDLVGGLETYGGEVERTDEIRIDLWPRQLVRVSPPGGWVEHAGVYRMRVRASGVRSLDGRPPHLAVHAETLDRLLYERDVVAAETAPVVFEFEAHLPVGAHVFTFENELPGPSILTRLGRSGQRPFYSLAEGRIPWQLPLVDDERAPLWPVLILDRVEWEGPLPVAAGHPREQYLPDPAASMEEVASRLARFAARAFRRPLRDGEVERYLRLVEREVAGGADPVTAVKTAMVAILCSKDFLYLAEGSVGADASALDPWQLASRLSYFLWSTMPDATLRGLAADGALLSPETRRDQAARMLADPRAERFVESFARQWLQLDRVGMFAPNVELYPDYDAHLERGMVRETTAFFGEVLARDLGLRELLASDWTMLDERLARHYGIAGVSGDGFRRVALEPRHHRGGILTHASVLSLTSDGTRHRPVHRGVWLAESIFGDVPPPPPANVEPIEPTPVDARKKTVRTQLEAHASDPSCAACHERTDPYGFAFEHYDAIGRWRTEEVVPTGVGPNPPVDASGVLPDGRAFSNGAEFQELLVDDIDRFHFAFVEKLATYALRRPMGAGDRGELERIAAASAAGGYRLRGLVEALVTSELFAGR